jgi:O-acetyl-ADP-ribose deacetylase (regulator of RNase III)
MIINGNILDVKKGIIVHQVNNRGVMGAGLAKQIRALYPQHYQDYKSQKLNLGSLVITTISPKELYIIGLIAQDGYGRDKCYTNYEAFTDCLKHLHNFHNKYPHLNIYMPYGIGCGLAGGNWDHISKLINTIIPSTILVKYKKVL